MKKTLHFLVSVIALLVFSANLKAQVTGSPVSNADSLVSILLGNSSSIIVTGATLDCQAFGTQASGSFSATNSNLGMTGGIVLTTGDITESFGPNTATMTGTMGGNGDPLLNTLTTLGTTDVCILEFDMFIPGDSVKFNYVFGSEEYNFFVGSQYNDVFGFFISGPNPAGGMYTNYNIAQLPTSTSGNFNIVLNNVNCGVNGQYYVCNDWDDPTLGGCTTQCPTSSANTTVGYNGFTTVLTAAAHVVPCNTYHLKIAVGDVSDQSLDSGVFLEAGSLQSNAVTISLSSLYLDATGNPAAVENCNVNASLEISLNTYVLIGDTTLVNVGAQDTICFLLETSGSAIEGVDYETLPDSICFYPGDTLLTITIVPIADGIAEGVDSLVITLLPADSAQAGCGTQGASSLILIYDDPVVTATVLPDSQICIGESVQLSSGFAPNPVWTPNVGLSCNSCSNPTATPQFTTTYVVTASIAVCQVTDTVIVYVDNPVPVNASPDVSICIGQSTQLQASGSTVFSWSPSTGLSANDTSHVIANPTVTTTYTVHGQNACFESEDLVVVTVNPLPTVSGFGDTDICPEYDAQIGATSFGAVSFAWTPEESLSDPSSATPVADPESTTTYYVYATDANGCMNFDTVVVNVFVPEALNAQPPFTSMYINDLTVVQITTQAGHDFQWTPSEGLSDPTSSSPVANPTVSTVYVVTALDANNCFVSDTVAVVVIREAFVFVPNAFSPNGDGLNDAFRFKAMGVFILDRFSIFDRWGNEVFSTTKMDPDGFSEGWRGTINNSGSDAPLGSYAYSIVGRDLDNEPVVHQGNVTLIR